MDLRFKLRRSMGAHPVDGRDGLNGGLGGSGVVVAVTGATGAPGRTFISINLAAVAAASGLTVALVDADPHLGAIAVQLGLREDRSLSFLAHEATLRPVDDELLTRHLQLSNGVDVLAGRSVAAPGHLSSAPILSDTVRLLAARHELVVLDAGALVCPEAQATALASQMIVWVIVPTRSGTDLFDRVVAGPLAAALRSRPSLAVINKVATGCLREPERALSDRYGMAVGGSVPESRRACLEAEARAQPAAAGGPLAERLRHVGGVVLACVQNELANQSRLTVPSPPGPRMIEQT